MLDLKKICQLQLPFNIILYFKCCYIYTINDKVKKLHYIFMKYLCILSIRSVCCLSWKVVYFSFLIVNCWYIKMQLFLYIDFVSCDIIELIKNFISSTIFWEEMTNFSHFLKNTFQIFQSKEEIALLLRWNLLFGNVVDQLHILAKCALCNKMKRRDKMMSFSYVVKPKTNAFCETKLTNLWQCKESV